MVTVIILESSGLLGKSLYDKLKIDKKFFIRNIFE